MSIKRMDVLAVLCLMILLFGLPSAVRAGQSSVSVEAPATVQKGAEITVKISVAHSGNSRFHHTEWVSVKVNGQEVQRWEYSGSNTPESERFTKEFKIVVNEPLEIVAEASCNLHGSAGAAKAGVAVQ
jgi:desulfoferrodoxin (superoxide reductase-like protein)